VLSPFGPHWVNAVTDILHEGDIVTVKAMGMLKRGKLQLSMKDVEEAA
jgi:Polyribonucleotide nucleotidyltransferase (polynucleotide phosphorylase)